MNGLLSEKIAQLSGLTIVDRIVGFVKVAGGKSEEATDRQGFLSYHAETHAVGAGLGLGFMIGATGRWKLMGTLLGAVLYANNGEDVLDSKLLKDIRDELHYFVPCIMIGVLIGLGVNNVASM